MPTDDQQNSMGDSIFQETDISPEITVEEAPKFYQEHGIFYASDPEIGRSAETLGSNALCRDGINMFPVRDPRLQKVIEHFVENGATFWFTLGSDPGNFYVSTIKPNQDHRALVYIWGEETHLEFSRGSFLGELKGVPAANGLTQVPYTWLKKRGLQDVTVRMKEGGIMIVHPRLSFQVERGFALGYGCQKVGPSAGQGS